jgi:hypothetical protein
VTAFVTAGAGFLLAVLWFDLMFDVQVGGRATPAPAALESISAYYRRVTLQASPMNRLVALVMLGTIAALIAQLAQGDTPRWASGVCLALVLGACGLALFHTFGNGARLGSGRHPAERQERLARLMLRDHLLCLPAITAVLVIQLAFAR